MTAKYHQHVSTKKTPQSEPIPGSNQVDNSAGGFSFVVDRWTRLERFLILGAEGGTYYASERKLTQENAKVVIECANKDLARTIDKIVQISHSGRAAKNDAAIFAMALLASNKPEPDQLATIMNRLSDVCRIGTHLFQFVETCNELRGWGRAFKRGIQNWYLNKEAGNLAYQVMKYQSRNGWSHKDVLRLCHPKSSDSNTVTILNWIVKGWDSVGEMPHPDKALQGIWAFEKAKKATDKNEIIRLIRDYKLPRECIPTKWLNEATVWEALLESMPMTAMIRSLAKMTDVGLLSPLSQAVKKVCETVTNKGVLGKTRIHPLSVLVALNTYNSGKGEKGKLKWSPVQQIVDALDSAFYLAFDTITPTNKRWLLALDVSGSMSSPCIQGMTGISPRIGSAAMAMVTAATEAQHHIVGFTTNGWGRRVSKWGMRYPSSISPLPISPKQRLNDVVSYIAKLPMGGTDCALPMIYAMENKIPVDTFAIYTDSETWAGDIHPVQALQEYRQKMSIPAKLIVVGMVSNGFSIASPDDLGMLDVVGFDTATPALMADFAISQ